MRVKIEAAGVNYIDIYHRTGLYPNDVPFTLGMEAAGVVDAVGKDVSGVRKGDRVAYAMNLGSYAEYAVVPAWMLAPIPNDIDTKTACAAMLQGMTAHYLTHSTFKIKKNDILDVGFEGLQLKILNKNNIKEKKYDTLKSKIQIKAVGNSIKNKIIQSKDIDPFFKIINSTNNTLKPIEKQTNNSIFLNFIILTLIIISTTYLINFKK